LLGLDKEVSVELEGIKAWFRVGYVEGHSSRYALPIPLFRFRFGESGGVFDLTKGWEWGKGDEGLAS